MVQSERAPHLTLAPDLGAVHTCSHSAAQELTGAGDISLAAMLVIQLSVFAFLPSEP